MNDLSLQRILTDGAILSGVLGAIILGSLVYNPRLWRGDAPKAMQDATPPLTDREKRERNLLAALLLLAMFGGLVLSATQLRAANGGPVTFLTAFLHAFLVFNLFNLFDAVVLDLLIIALWQPKFILMPGTEGLGHTLRDWGEHMRNYLKGIVVSAIIALPIALVAML